MTRTEGSVFHVGPRRPARTERAPSFSPLGQSLNSAPCTLSLPPAWTVHSALSLLEPCLLSRRVSCARLSPLSLTGSSSSLLLSARFRSVPRRRATASCPYHILLCSLLFFLPYLSRTTNEAPASHASRSVACPCFFPLAAVAVTHQSFTIRSSKYTSFGLLPQKNLPCHTTSLS